MLDEGKSLQTKLNSINFISVKKHHIRAAIKIVHNEVTNPNTCTYIYRVYRRQATPQLKSAFSIALACDCGQESALANGNAAQVEQKGHMLPVYTIAGLVA
jgi:hypothetical protein